MAETSSGDLPSATKLRSGDPDYRAYVGGPGRYDVLAGAQFSFLLDAGLREEHRVVDIGCGSLRLGRLLIPFLLPDRYFGVEPNEWLVHEGFERELGTDIKELKRPRFRYVDDFSLDGFGQPFDFAVAYSVFTHCYPDLAEQGLRQVAQTLSPGGVLIATFVENPTGETGRSKLLAPNGTGWLYPKCVKYTWEEFSATLERAGLVGERVERPAAHRQEWFVAARPEHRKAARRVARAAARGPVPEALGDMARRAVTAVRRDPRGTFEALRKEPREALAKLRRPPARRAD
jgi:SAM-dependent methyltransferase